MPRVALVARVARPDTSKAGDGEPARITRIAGAGLLRNVNIETNTRASEVPADRIFPSIKGAGVTTLGIHSQDADAYLAALTLHGPMTYGAAAAALGWGATRAWVAEAALVAEGRATMTREGRTSANIQETS